MASGHSVAGPTFLAPEEMAINLTRQRQVCGATLLALLCWQFHGAAQSQTLMQSGPLKATAEDVRAIAETIPNPQRRNTYGQPENVRRQAEEVLLRRWLAQKAVEAGLDKTALTAARIQQAREHVLSEAWLKQQAEADTPTPDSITRYAQELYRSQPEKFRTGDEWQARHILIGPPNSDTAKQKANALLAELKAGADFAALAKQHSVDKSSGARGGDLGWFAAGTMVKPFQDAVAAMVKPGELSNVVETQFGYHLIKLEGKRPAGIRTFEEVQVDLEREVLAALKNSARERVVAKAMPDPITDAPAVEALARELAKP